MSLGKKKCQICWFSNRISKVQVVDFFFIFIFFINLQPAFLSWYSLNFSCRFKYKTASRLGPVQIRSDPFSYMQFSSSSLEFCCVGIWVHSMHFKCIRTLIGFDLSIPIYFARSVEKLQVWCYFLYAIN